MHIDYVILADAATAVQGKHYLLGAGWDTLLAAAFPVSYPTLGVALRLRGTPEPSARPHRLEIDVVDTDERSILPVPPGPLQTTVRMEKPPGAPVTEGEQALCLAFTLVGVTFPHAGSYAVVAHIDDAQARTQFTVAAAPQAQGDGVVLPLHAVPR